MQGAALIGRIVCAVVMAVAAMVGMMMVNVVCYAGPRKIIGNIPLGFDDVLKMGAVQRRQAGDLRKKKQA